MEKRAESKSITTTNHLHINQNQSFQQIREKKKRTSAPEGKANIGEEDFLLGSVECRILFPSEAEQKKPTDMFTIKEQSNKQKHSLRHLHRLLQNHSESPSLKRETEYKTSAKKRIPNSWESLRHQIAENIEQVKNSKKDNG